MLNRIKNLSPFTKNIIFVFAGSSIANFLNLIYQLFIAHKFSPSDFAAFNSLLSIFTLFFIPLSTLQFAVAKYAAAFKAQGHIEKTRTLLLKLLRKFLLFAAATLILFLLFSFYIIAKLKIDSPASGFILALLVASSWLAPIFLGGVQGLELFGWLVLALIGSGVVKLILTFIFVLLGFKIAGALGALLVSNLLAVFIAFFSLKNSLIPFNLKVKDDIDFKEILIYLFPVAVSNLCYIWLVTFDMVMVKYFFSPEASGSYSLAQMLGKIFLFLPGAISMVMFPRASSLNATNSDTSHILKKSLIYASFLGVSAAVVYNLFPSFILKLLTGKAFPESILLGRLFSLSMTFFALLLVIINYLLSIKDLCFIKYLAVFTFLQFLGIILFHKTLYQVQFVLCASSILLFSIHLILAYRNTLWKQKRGKQCLGQLSE